MVPLEPIVVFLIWHTGTPFHTVINVEFCDAVKVTSTKDLKVS